MGARARMGRWCPIVLFLLVAGVWEALAMWPALLPGAGSRLYLLGRVSAAALFVGAGALIFVRARLAASARISWNAAAFSLIGTGILLAGVLSGATVQSPDGLHPVPLTRLLLVAPALVVFLVATGRRVVVHCRHVAAVVAAAIGCQAAAGVVLAEPAITRAVLRVRLNPLWVIESLVVTALWVLVAVRIRRWDRQRPAPMRGWCAAAVALMAVSEGLHLARFAGVARAGTLGAGLELVAAGVVFTVAARRLRAALASASRNTLLLADDVDGMQRLLRASAEREQLRLHDARAAAAGVLGAARLLAADEADRSVRDELRLSISAELHRLTGLLDPDAQEHPRAFSLHEALDPVIAARRATGLAVRAEFEDLRAVGRPFATATVVANLLDNAARHAPGAMVTVTAALVAGQVQLCVDDDGPGIPPEMREFVVRRGARIQTPTAGSGMGLPSARQTMIAQRGTLRIDARADGQSGTRVVLRLPAATAGRLEALAQVAAS